MIRNADPKDFGGAETYPISLMSTLERVSDYEPVIATGSNKLLTYAKGRGKKTIKSPYLTHQNWTGWRTLLIPLYAMWQAYLVVWYYFKIKSINPSVVHIQSRDDFIAASISAKLLGKRVIWTDHMDLRYVLENSQKPFRNIVAKLVLWASRYADSIILISKNEEKLVLGHIPPNHSFRSKVTLVNNGVSDTLSETLTRSQRNPADKAFHLATVSRAVKSKGIGEAIDAFKTIIKLPTNRPVVLDIYGDGPDLQYFKDKVASEDIKGVVFHGHTDDPHQAMLDADVFMLPSYQEGFSIALLEASMLGKAIIVTNVDSNPEIITDGETGLLVNPRDSSALSKAMLDLVNNKDLADRLEKNARENYLKNYSLESIAKNNILPLYE